MAAVIEFHPHAGATARHVVARAAPTRPALRVIEGGRSAAGRRLRRTYLRRRVAVAAVLVVVLVVLAQAVGALASGSTTDARVPASPAVSTHVVHSGDTLWSIAARVAPGMDRRLAVDRLAAANGGTTALRVGQVVQVPASLLAGT